MSLRFLSLVSAGLVNGITHVGCLFRFKFLGPRKQPVSRSGNPDFESNFTVLYRPSLSVDRTSSIFPVRLKVELHLGPAQLILPFVVLVTPGLLLSFCSLFVQAPSVIPKICIGVVQLFVSKCRKGLPYMHFLFLRFPIFA